MSPPSQGYESTRMVPDYNWVPKLVISQDLKLSQVSLHPQQYRYPSLFYPSCATQENGPPPFSSMQSIRKSFSFLLGILEQLVWNINARTLRTRCCEKNRAQDSAFQTYNPQVTAGSHQQPLQPTISWISSSAAMFPLPSQDADDDGSMDESGGMHGSAWGKNEWVNGKSVNMSSVKPPPSYKRQI